MNYLEWADFPWVYRLPESGVVEGEFLKERQLGSGEAPTSTYFTRAAHCAILLFGVRLRGLTRRPDS